MHRIGRTGRAGSRGHAISLVSSEESGLLREIERFIKREIPRQTVPGYSADLVAHKPVGKTGQKMGEKIGQKTDDKPKRRRRRRRSSAQRRAAA